MRQHSLSTCLLTGLLLISLTGCGTKTTLPVPTEASATASSAAAPSESTPASTPEADVPTETASVSETLPAEEIEPQMQAPESPVSENVPSTSEHPEVSEPPASAERPAESSPVKPEPESPVESTSEPSAPEPTEPKPTEEESEPAFDVGYWVDFAKAYAESVGLRLESSAVDCWDNPIDADADCIYLERDICSRLNRYAADETITDIWVWYEAVGANSYLIYIGYA